MHVQYAPQLSFVQIAVLPLSYCSGVPCLVIPAQNFTNSEDPMFIASPLWHVLLVLPNTGNNNGKCPPTRADGSQSLSRVGQLVCLQLE